MSECGLGYDGFRGRIDGEGVKRWFNRQNPQWRASLLSGNRSEMHQHASGQGMNRGDVPVLHADAVDPGGAKAPRSCTVVCAHGI